jgi:CheY-like chemotaxis protein
MGGFISVESTPGKGSKFSFEITLSRENLEADISEDAAPFYGGKKPIFDGEALLCEDNTMNQQVAGVFLAKAGLRTVLADNGKDGLEKVKERVDNIKNGTATKQFDIIFMDMHMPVMDGVEATGKILALDPAIPIIAMTANIMPDDVNLYLSNGVSECLSKPFVSQELSDCLLRYLKPVSWLDQREEGI